MQELLWLLLPIAAASGWVAARRSASGKESGPAFQGDEYFRGLNYLLENRPDKAIEVFVRMAEVDQDTVETHLTLGSLFRRRGEVGRAIQIHENLIARPRLTREQRARALLELGEDYLKAGLYDRAEGLFRDLVKQSAHVAHALRNLAAIYEHEKEWDAAIRNAQELERVSGGSRRLELSQFYCELAEEAIAAGHYDLAADRLREALDQDSGCARASLITAHLAMNAEHYDEALKHLKRVEDQDPTLIPVVVPLVRTCFANQGHQDDLIRYLREVAERHPSGCLSSVLADLYQHHRGAAAAETYLSETLRDHASAAGLRRLLELKLADANEPLRTELRPLYEAVLPLFSAEVRYRCSHCGFEGKTLHWQCPGCRHWNTVRPFEPVWRRGQPHCA